MTFVPIIAIASAIYAVGLACYVLARQERTLANATFSAGMLVLAVEAVFNALSVAASEPEGAIRWGIRAYAAMALTPGIWLLFSLAYARGNFRDFFRRWWPLVGAAFVLPLALVLGLPGGLILSVRLQPAGGWDFGLGYAAFYLNILHLIGLVLILMNLECTLRTSVGVMRWRIKFMVMGLGLLLLLRIYSSSQVLLYLRTDAALKGLNAGALLLACVLITGSLVRRSLIKIDVYPSQVFLFNSLAVLLAGVYLLIVGVLAKLVNYLGGDEAFPVKSFFMLVAVVGLALLFFSERARQHFRRFVSRHFQRPFYDYQKIWSTFTQRTSSLMHEADFCRAAVKWISETFQALSVTVWVLNTQKTRLYYPATTSLSENTSQNAILEDIPWIDLLASARAHSHSQPVDVEESQEAWAAAIKKLNPSFFPGKGGDRVYVPLIARDEWLGMIVVGDRVSGMPFSFEDFDLLKCVGDQMAGSLLNIELSRKLMAAKEMEAFQTMSTFFVHDLKNTASTLSLMLQNMQEHFDDPAFREDARRAVSKSVNHINDLIDRLSLLRQGLKPNPVPAYLHEVAREALESVGPLPGVTLTRKLNPTAITSLDPEQIQKVVTNLVLNSRDAVGGDGEIQVETGQENGWVTLSVTDNGCGMSAEFINKSLFRPFQTMKKKGVGIGMFHSKMIVEAHQGRIEVTSEAGAGTAFRVLLPIKTK